MHCNVAKDFSDMGLATNLQHFVFQGPTGAQGVTQNVCLSVWHKLRQSVSGLNALLCSLLFWSVGA